MPAIVSLSEHLQLRAQGEQELRRLIDELRCAEREETLPRAMVRRRAPSGWQRFLGGLGLGTTPPPEEAPPPPRDGGRTVEIARRQLERFLSSESATSRE